VSDHHGSDRSTSHDSHGTSHGASRVEADGTTEHHDRRGVSRHEVVDREREEHGGVKIGSAFFGWLTATGMAVVLTALAAAAGAVFGIATDTSVSSATDSAAEQADTVGIVGGVVLLAIVFIAYYCGGYVAGRMARFDGLKQGLAVWLWAIVIAVLVGVLGTVVGSEYNVLSQLNSFPRLPVGEGTMTTGGIVALVVVLVASLAGALLGGLAGMRFHRAVDRTGLDR
jgi:hypothetical protein